MDLLFVRHAVALDREAWATNDRPDGERPLTSPGRARMKLCAAGLAAVVDDLKLIATSPFVRAADTAKILGSAFPGVPRIPVQALASGGSRKALQEWLAQREETCIALVGHEPDLGRSIGWYVGGKDGTCLPLRKGGACLLRFRGCPEPGKGSLRWLLPPALLEKLAAR